MKVSQLAINTVSTRQSSLEEALEAYAAAGFRQVEFQLGHLKDWLALGHTVADVGALLATHGLHCIGGFQARVDCFSEPDAQRANHQLHRDNAAILQELGGGTLVVGTDGPPQPSLEALDTIGDTIAALAESLHAPDVTLAVEFNWSPIVRSLHSAVRVAERANHPQVGVLFDPAHYYVTPTKFEHLTAATVRWIKHVHLDDMQDKPGDLSHCNADRVLPGQGILDLPAIIARLEACGYDGWYAIEMFNAELWQTPVMEAARACYQSLLPLCG
ncbi:MAG TPA: sugar phosphate isomerase/epimerase family protein [Chloroflexota bacterium]